MSVKSRSRIWLWLGLTGLALVAGGLYGWRTLRPRSLTKGPAPATSDSHLATLDFQPRMEEGSLPLSSAYNTEKLLAAHKISLSKEQRAFLEANKFVLVPLAGTKLANTENYDDMLEAFDRAGGDPDIAGRSPENARLVTPDLALHAFHKFFSMTLEELEKAELRSQLKDFLSGLAGAASRARKEAPAAARSGYERIQTQAAVALTLLETRGEPVPGTFENPEAEQAFKDANATADNLANAKHLLSPLVSELPPEMQQKAEEELALIYGASGMAPSPLFGAYDPTAQADYTQYTPRSYYAKSPDLRAYFRAMMFLGRNGYVVKGDLGLSDTLLLANLFTRKDASGKTLVEGWQRIMAVTALYAGDSDDLTYTEWIRFMQEAMGVKDVPFESASDPAFLARLRANLGKLPAPRIQSGLTMDRAKSEQALDQRLSESTAFRIFGQRFTYDAWMLGRLTNGEMKYPATALYIPAIMGDPRARAHAAELVAQDPKFGAAGATKLQQDVEALSQELAKEPKEVWERSMAASWLDLLGTLTRTYGPGFPRYMQAAPFGDKQLQTFLGSYTELKHDTLLYAKQNYAEMGGGADERPIPPVVKGFVEPNILFWAKLSGLLQHTQTFLDRQGLFKEGAVKERLAEFTRHVTFFHNLAVKELKGEPISEDDYEKLRTLRLSFMAEPLAGFVEITEDTGKSALVADIHTDGKAGKVLYEGTGRPYLMLALVGNEASPRLTVGLVLSHTEFSASFGGPRLTDEIWRKRVYATPAQLPPRNIWYRSLALK